MEQTRPGAVNPREANAPGPDANPTHGDSDAPGRVSDAENEPSGPLSPPNYIAVEGPIGVGKTTLARRLADTFHRPLVLEPAMENPFLDRFYREGRRHALPTQLFFLLHRANQVANISRDDMLGAMLVTDFLMEKDRLFAKATLDDNELELYEDIYRSLDIRPPRPDLVVYLQAPVSVLLDRIRRRGIAYEQRIDSEYLTMLTDAYTEFFHYYDSAPLLIINAAEIDFADNEAHYRALVEQVEAMDGVRQYFNPNPTLL